LRSAHLFLPISIAVAGWGIAGCGETRIDAAKAETLIRDLVRERVGAKVATVSCPKGITARKGVRFTCRVAGTDATHGDVVVTGRDGRGTVEVTAPFLLVRRSEVDMARKIDDELGEPVAVTCPEIVVIRKGARFHCTARSGGRSRDVAGRFLDDSGKFSFLPA
jgi:hypothetical protein